MTRRKILSLLMLLLIFFLNGCSNSNRSEEIITEQNISEEKENDLVPEAEDNADEKNSSFKEEETHMNKNILVVYFSCTNTTKTLAEYAAEILEADLYEIVPETPYTEEDLAYYTNGRADQEQNDPVARPAISGGVENMDAYDTIILGFPIWHGQAPRIISTFLESYDFAEKTMIPFCTSHSSGIGSSAINLHSLCSDSAIWLDGERFESGTLKEMIKDWLEDVL